MVVFSKILIFSSSLQEYRKCKHNVDYITKQNLLHCNVFKLSIKYPKGRKRHCIKAKLHPFVSELLF